MAIGCASRFRKCVNAGCENLVNKRTAKYCSVNCCANDPMRREKIRKSAKQSSKRLILPLAKQLTLDRYMTFNPEVEIAAMCYGREDVPSGLSRLVG